MSKRNRKWPARIPGDLPELTPKQFAFVKGILEGLTASDAYRHAYDADGMADATIWAESSRQHAGHKVSAWLQRARVAALGDLTMSKAQYLAELHGERCAAQDSGDSRQSLRALELIGKVQGHFVERKEIGVSSELVDLVRQISAMRAPVIDVTPVPADKESAGLPAIPPIKTKA